MLQFFHEITSTVIISDKGTSVFQKIPWSILDNDKISVNSDDITNYPI